MRLSDVLLEVFLNTLFVSSLWTTKRKNECQQCCIHFLRIFYLSVGSHFQGQSNTSTCGYNLHIWFLVVLGKRKNDSVDDTATCSETNCGSNFSCPKAVVLQIYVTYIYIYLYLQTQADSIKCVWNSLAPVTCLIHIRWLACWQYGKVLACEVYSSHPSLRTVACGLCVFPILSGFCWVHMDDRGVILVIFITVWWTKICLVILK